MACLVALILILVVCPVHAQISWTFDCGPEGWNETLQEDRFESRHHPTNLDLPSGHIQLQHKDGEPIGTIYSPEGTYIDADRHKYFLMSVLVSGTGPVGRQGIPGKLVWSSPTTGIASRHFMIDPGQSVCRIDLGGQDSWRGKIQLLKIQIPETRLPSKFYTYPTARFLVDWMALSDDPGFVPQQDPHAECQPDSLPRLSDCYETAVFGTSVSIKAEMQTGMLSDLSLKVWQDGEPVRNWKYGKEDNGTIYATLSFLAPEKTYQFVLSIANKAGADSVSGTFTTEKPVDYDLQGAREIWFTPSPFARDCNTLFHPDNIKKWKDAAGTAATYHIREDQLHDPYYKHYFGLVDIPSMLFHLNKLRMKLALEAVGLIPRGFEHGVQGVADASVAHAREVLNKLYEKGGKLDYLSPDGAVRKVTRIHIPEGDPQLSMDEAIDAYVIYVTKLKAEFPNLQIGYLVNYPNYNFEYNGRLHYGSNFGTFTDKSGYTFDRILASAIQRLAVPGQQIDFVEVDSPYKPYYLRRSHPDHPGISYNDKEMMKAIESLCRAHSLRFGIIVNSQTGGESSNKKYYQETLEYLKIIDEDGFNPDFVNVESWYTYPDRLFPETGHYTFMHLLKDFGETYELRKK
jgi:hypothetical protein